MAADAATSTTASTVTRRMILAKILCYIQSKMNNSKHDFIVKTVVDFYSEDDIHEAKVLLFEECIETNMRLNPIQPGMIWTVNYLGGGGSM